MADNNIKTKHRIAY